MRKLFSFFLLFIITSTGQAFCTESEEGHQAQRAVHTRFRMHQIPDELVSATDTQPNSLVCLDELLELYNKVPGQPATSLTFSGAPTTIADLFADFAMINSGECSSCRHLQYNPTNNEWVFDFSNQGLSSQQLFGIITSLLINEQRLTQGKGFNIVGLDISGNELSDSYDIATIFAHRAFTNLQRLNLSNSINSYYFLHSLIDSFSNLTKLKELDVRQEHLFPFEHDTMLLFYKSFSHLSSLRVLKIANTLCSAQDCITTLFANLPISTLEELDVSGSYFKGTARETFIKVLPNFTSLQSLNLSGIAIDDAFNKSVFAWFGPAISKVVTLRRLDFSHCITEKAPRDSQGDYIAAMIRTLKNLQYLNLGDNYIPGITSYNALATALSELRNLRYFNMTRCGLFMPDAIPLLTAITSLPSLESLYILQFNQWEDELLNTLRKYWNKRNTQTDIYQIATCNDIKNYFASLTPPVIEVDLSGQMWRPEQIISCFIEQLTAHKRTLRRLNLAGNSIYEWSAYPLVQGLQAFTQLTVLNLSGVKLDGRSDYNTPKVLASTLQQLSNLQSLILSDCWIGLQQTEDLVWLMQGLQSLPRLVSLDISSNLLTSGIPGYGQPLSSSIQENFMHSLVRMTNLIALNISDTGLGNAFAVGRKVTIIFATGVGGMQQLKALNVGKFQYNRWTEFPKYFGESVNKLSLLTDFTFTASSVPQIDLSPVLHSLISSGLYERDYDITLATSEFALDQWSNKQPYVQTWQIMTKRALPSCKMQMHASETQFDTSTTPNALMRPDTFTIDGPLLERGMPFVFQEQQYLCDMIDPSQIIEGRLHLYPIEGDYVYECNPVIIQPTQHHVLATSILNGMTTTNHILFAISTTGDVVEMITKGAGFKELGIRACSVALGSLGTYALLPALDSLPYGREVMITTIGGLQVFNMYKNSFNIVRHARNIWRYFSVTDKSPDEDIEDVESPSPAQQQSEQSDNHNFWNKAKEVVSNTVQNVKAWFSS